MELLNRVVMAPMGSASALPDGQVSQRNIDYYRAIAEGGTALIVVEASYPDDIASKGEDGQIGVANGSHTPGLAVLASVIHETYGCKCALQINHEGQQISLVDRLESWGPSSITLDVNGQP
jgi:2,4-dienoyl-CoA reductase-like NADH-dependent reductase (Old Yellow Enzyme family)